jgi:uncharacterized protein DUF4386
VSIPIQRYARITGVLLLVSAVAGGFGEAYVPSRLVVSDNAAATARNIVASEGLFRLGFAGFLVESLCDTALTWLFYILLRPVSRDLALLAVFFRLISTAGFACAEVLVFAPVAILGGADYLKTFSPDQLNTLALLWTKIGYRGEGVFSMCYGAGSVVYGYLIARSSFMPRLLGVLLALSGLAFMASTFLAALAPSLATPLLAAPTIAAMVLLMLWMLVKGVNVTQWQESAAAADARGA